MHTALKCFVLFFFHYEDRPRVFCAEWQCKNASWAEASLFHCCDSININLWACKERVRASRKGSITALSLVRQCHAVPRSKLCKKRGETTQAVTGVLRSVVAQPFMLHGDGMKTSNWQMVRWLSLLKALRTEEQTGELKREGVEHSEDSLTFITQQSDMQWIGAKA